MPRIIITGSTGQTGSYLVEEMAKNGWEVHGISTQEPGSGAGIHHFIDVSDPVAFTALLNEVRPDGIINLAAISNVSESWTDPVLTAAVNCLPVAIALKHVQKELSNGHEVRFVQASSALILEPSGKERLCEDSRIHARNPYAATKAFGHLLTQTFREAGCAASNAILFNHESPRRPTTFVTRKITNAVAKISLGLQDKLTLGSLDASRDWGWAPDYANALKLILNAPKADDFIVASGVSHSVRDFVSAAFETVGINDWAPYVTSEPDQFRSNEEQYVIGDSSKIKEELGWTPTKGFREIVHEMVMNDLAMLSST